MTEATNNETVKLKEPKLVMDEWRKLVKSSRVFMVGGQAITHYFGESGDCIATGLGEGPYHLQMFIFRHIEALEAYNKVKAVQDEAERAIIEANRAAKVAAQEATKTAGKKPFVRTN